MNIRQTVVALVTATGVLLTGAATVSADPASTPHHSQAAPRCINELLPALTALLNVLPKSIANDILNIVGAGTVDLAMVTQLLADLIRDGNRIPSDALDQVVSRLPAPLPADFRAMVTAPRLDTVTIFAGDLTAVVNRSC